MSEGEVFLPSGMTELERRMSEASIEELLYPWEELDDTGYTGWREGGGYDDEVLREVRHRIENSRTDREMDRIYELLIDDTGIEPDRCYEERFDRGVMNHLGNESWRQLAEIFWENGGRISYCDVHEKYNGLEMEVASYRDVFQNPGESFEGGEK